MRSRTKLAIAALTLFAASALGVSSASASVPIEALSQLPSTTQSGGHPDIATYFKLKNGPTRQGTEGLNTPCACELARDIVVHSPQGLVGNPHAYPRCTFADFAVGECPVDSQIGIASVLVSSSAAGGASFAAAVYNMETAEEQAGLLAFKDTVFGAPVFEVFSGRTGGDYGLDTKVAGILSGIPVREFHQVLWGAPSEPRHDVFRFPFGEMSHIFNTFFCDGNGAHSTVDPNTVVSFCSGGPAVPSSNPPRPFISNPTRCGVPLESTIEVLSYDGETTQAAAPYPGTTGCDQVSFNPSQAIRPTTTAADSPSGADFELNVPSFQSISVPSPSSLREATVTLPPGFTATPKLIDGKIGCTDAEASYGTELAARCPEHSKIGSISVETDLLPAPLTGFVYLGEPKPGDPYRMILVFDGFGVHVKLPGSIRPDPDTGQITIRFVNLPEAPFERFTMHVFGSERGPLGTPTRCGTYEVKSVFRPWNNALPDQTSRQFFDIDTGPNGDSCPGPSRPFAPSFEAASGSNAAGEHAPFALEIKRPDGDQELTGLDVAAPLGLAADLSGVPYCPEAAIAALSSPFASGYAELGEPGCPAASQVGTTVAGAAAGSRPYYQAGRVYLAGPYKGAPLSLLAVVPAVGGPFDLGNVAVRAAIQVDPVTARVRAVTDPLPQIVEGVPLRIRSIRVDLNRRDFALNPTNCDPLSVDVAVLGSEGAVARRAAHFQVANCARMPFEPGLRLRLTGGLNRRGHPAVHALLTSRPGEANLDRVSVTLPKGELLDQSHIRTVCTRVAFAAGACPSESRIGRAEATSPILDQPLRGPVYLRASSHQLPDMVLDLDGQFDFEAAARVDSVGGRLRTTFENVPDVPLSSVVLDLDGGAKGLLANSEDLCAKRKHARAKFRGQNGRQITRSVRLEVACGSKRTKGGRHALLHQRGVAR